MVIRLESVVELEEIIDGLTGMTAADLLTFVKQLLEAADSDWLFEQLGDYIDNES